MKIKSTVFILAASALTLGACSSMGPPQEREETSGLIYSGKQHDITLFRRFFKKKAAAQEKEELELVDNPEYQEFLEWKRWQEFKAYQEWKRNNPGATGSLESDS